MRYLCCQGSISLITIFSYWKMLLSIIITISTGLLWSIYLKYSLPHVSDSHIMSSISHVEKLLSNSCMFPPTADKNILPLQGILHSALHNQYWRLIDPQGKLTEVMGCWPSRTVTFLENHDTGSTQVLSSSLSYMLTRVCIHTYIHIYRKITKHTSTQSSTMFPECRITSLILELKLPCNL